MRVIIAPDSYKGSVSALEVARAMQRGVQTVFPHAEIQLVPIADGSAAPFGKDLRTPCDPAPAC